MLLMVMRKLWKNKWMFFCLLLGSVLAVGMVCSIPLYTDGVLNRMLRRDLELYQQKSGVYPGRFLYECNFSGFEMAKRGNNLNFFEQELSARAQSVPLPIVQTTRSLELSWLHARPENAPAEQKGKSLKVLAMKDIERHITLISGSMPSAQGSAEGVVELMMPRKVMLSSNYTMGQVLDVADTRDATGLGSERVYPYTMKMKIVGVYDVLDIGDGYWYDGGRQANASMMMNYDLALERFVYVEKPLLHTYSWYIAYDYRELRIDNLPAAIAALQANIEWLRGYFSGPASAPGLTTMEAYANREAKLRTMLTVMQVPILVMLAFYVLMVTRLIIDNERGEISVLKSRGASSVQVLLMYLMQSLLIALTALPLGVGLGYLICSVLGASNGFLEFVTRRALPIRMTQGALRYALVTAVFLVATMLIPALSASRIGVVEQKQSRVHTKIALWKKTGVDIILLALAGYGYYAYQIRQQTLAVTAGNASEVPVDPLLFVISMLFLMGCALFFLRFYPLALRGLFRLGRRIWTPALYASFLHVGRSGGKEQFLMLFLIITMALGIFSANSARTINLNVEEKIRYKNGADMALTVAWRSNERMEVNDDMGGAVGTGKADVERGYANERHISYVEPPFSGFSQLVGVEHAAKVFIKDDATMTILGRASARGRVMAIDPAEFGKTAFMPEELLRPHWYEYLNLLAADPAATLLSRDVAERLKVSPGDSFTVTWSEQNPITLRVYAIIDYWPTFNSLERESANLMVMNLSTVRSNMVLEPYRVWLRLAENTTSAQIYEQIEQQKLPVDELIDSGQDLIEAKNDPMLQGTNGALTMAFIVTMTVSFCGFIIYWVLSIRSRELQFGILRAMGMSMRSIVGMLLWEQMLISGVAILMGILLGGFTARFFTPLLQMVYDAAEQMPPFRVVASREDYAKIYAIVSVMIAVGFTALGVLISRIRITQALKLGED